MESFKKEDEDGIYWENKEGRLHRVDGPAVEWHNGYKEWWFDGKRHREDGPAVEWEGGHKEWYINGNLHRLDGPAIKSANGYKAWCKNGKNYKSEEAWFESLTEQQKIAYLFRVKNGKP